MTVNAGSSSIKLTLFTDLLQRMLEVEVTNIGQPQAALALEDASNKKHTTTIQAANHEEAVAAIFDNISSQLASVHLAAIGHRVVHGGQAYDEPVALDAEVVSKLKNMAPFDPEHTKAAAELMEILGQRFPQTPQVACFDTSFYKDLPAVARLLPLPRKFEELGLRRYGFHGLSYEYLLQRLREVAGNTAANGRLVLAHLGSGASLTAVKDGKPLDTTMSFTPASGIPMSTRAGDIDPGIAWFLHQQAGMSLQEFNHMVHFESGLLGLSGLSADMELLINESANNRRAAEAVDLFCYQIQKAIGSLSAVLGGLDALVFAGGIGENAPVVREKVCAGLDYLGITLDTQRNHNHEFLISRGSSANVHVMHTDEAVIIATQTQQTIKNNAK